MKIVRWLKSKWKYYLDDAKQEPKVRQELNKIYEEHSHLQPEDLKVIESKVRTMIQLSDCLAA